LCGIFLTARTWAPGKSRRDAGSELSARHKTTEGTADRGVIL
jgi:hypothetical protein